MIPKKTPTAREGTGRTAKVALQLEKKLHTKKMAGTRQYLLVIVNHAEKSVSEQSHVFFAMCCAEWAGVGVGEISGASDMH